jgi:hypothetical protein
MNPNNVNSIMDVFLVHPLVTHTACAVYCLVAITANDEQHCELNDREIARRLDLTLDATKPALWELEDRGFIRLHYAWINNHQKHVYTLVLHNPLVDCRQDEPIAFPSTVRLVEDLS